MAPSGGRPQWDRSPPAIDRSVASVPKPVIAGRSDGSSSGAGWIPDRRCDIRLASTDAGFLRSERPSWPSSPDLGSLQRLPENHQPDTWPSWPTTGKNIRRRPAERVGCQPSGGRGADGVCDRALGLGHRDLPPTRRSRSKGTKAVLARRRAATVAEGIGLTKRLGTRPCLASDEPSPEALPPSWKSASRIFQRALTGPIVPSGWRDVRPIAAARAARGKSPTDPRCCNCCDSPFCSRSGDGGEAGRPRPRLSTNHPLARVADSSLQAPVGTEHHGIAAVRQLGSGRTDRPLADHHPRCGSVRAASCSPTIAEWWSTEQFGTLSKPDPDASDSGSGVHRAPTRQRPGRYADPRSRRRWLPRRRRWS